MDHGRNESRQAKHRDNRYDEGMPLARVQLYSQLNPGGSALAKIVFFDRDANDAAPSAGYLENSPPYAPSDGEITIHDPMRLTWAQTGDRIWVVYKRDSSRWETFNIGSRLERGVLNEELVEGGSASVSIYRRRAITDDHGTPTGDSELYDTGIDVIAWDSLLTDGNSLEMCTRVHIAIFPDGFVDVINASCTPIDC